MGTYLSGCLQNFVMLQTHVLKRTDLLFPDNIVEKHIYITPPINARSQDSKYVREINLKCLLCICCCHRYVSILGKWD